ncbi:Myb-like DNA-binding domain containing protein [Trichomonas vaginalis G3]|uniref:Myb-like DNA-binding domain containing protein n=1 Tax=Trichomonas vaginalis (strain ATCC PRA-98 / G3) TaxID=412133 RepID=A2EMU9_TRIV3|nr:RNA polymerase II transcription regulator recruiting protein [Trichomonas vaginalis G3]EAY06022.1 Myb-like DNA-binding domain containing protein [Trichomonas vaginalis G3]KAI5512813.1 RNA polymerase II transcription regulator recruiting protein [Trichomonas vaginalis G3]|eukprot:XP_001318245.1 Myb-like DNA-binding domain containing protein [Trichomonas vaginalis G3]
MAICDQSMMNIKYLMLPSIFTLPFPTYQKIPEIIHQSIQIPSSDDESTTRNDVEQPHKISVKGSWSQEEDALLKKAVLSQSPILWDIVAEQVPGRTAIQCKKRWLYRLHPEVKKTRFEKWEDDLIIAERKKHGNHWTLIATKLPGRTSCAVKNRWYSVLRNRN